MCTFCYLSPISAMPLPQINCNKFFFFFHPISVMPLPQIHSHKFFFFFFPQFRQRYCQKPTEINFFPSYFGNVIATIPFHFFLSQKNVTNQTVSIKKNTEKIRICVLFFISLIYFGNVIATNNKFFFLLCTFFCFCSQHFRIRILYLCSKYFFFCFCLHHFRIRILYLSLQRVSCNVLKTGPDRPVQPGTDSQSDPVKTLKTGQQPVKNRAKLGLN